MTRLQEIIIGKADRSKEINNLESQGLTRETGRGIELTYCFESACYLGLDLPFEPPETFPMPLPGSLVLTAVVVCSMIFITSCATLLNSPSQKIQISTEKNITHLRVEKSISNDSCILEMRKSVSYIVPRSSQGLIIHFRLDTTERTLLLQPRNSFAFWFNIPTNYGIGMFVDRDNAKRYSYPFWTYLTARDTVVERRRFPPVPKGKLRFSLGYSPLNIFSLASPEGRFNTGGIFGLEAGLDYFYKNDRYVSLSVGAATSAVPVDYIGYGYIRRANAFYANIRNNYVIGSFDLGYGINISELEWFQTIRGDVATLNSKANNVGFGLSLSAQYRISRIFRIGLSFQPDLLNTNISPGFNYQHYISANFCWKIPLR